MFTVCGKDGNGDVVMNQECEDRKQAEAVYHYATMRPELASVTMLGPKMGFGEFMETLREHERRAELPPARSAKQIRASVRRSIDARLRQRSTSCSLAGQTEESAYAIALGVTMGEARAKIEAHRHHLWAFEAMQNMRIAAE